MATIRIAQFNDIPLIKIFHDKLNNYYISLGDKHLPAALSDLQLKNDIRSFIIAEEDNNVIGVIRCKLNKSNSFTLSQLWVEEDYRGRGIGTSLIRNSIEVAKARGGNFLRLVVKDKNFDAKRMYEKLGFYQDATVMYFDI